MTQMKVQVKGPGIEKSISLIEDNISDFKRNLLSNTANRISNFSAETIDSGFYAASHQVSAGSISGAQTKQKPSNAKTIRRDGVPEISNAQDVGRSKMKGEIESMSMKNDKFYFTNEMEYAPEVEMKHGYSVYSKTVREMNNIISDALSAVRSR